MKFLILFLVCFILALQGSHAQNDSDHKLESIYERFAPWFYVHYKDKVLKKENAACTLKNTFRQHDLADDNGYLNKEKILKKLPHFPPDHIDKYVTNCSKKSNTEESHCEYTKCILDNYFHEELAFQYILVRGIDNQSISREDFWKCMEQKMELPQKHFNTFYNYYVTRGATYSCITDLLNLVDNDRVLDKEKTRKFAKNNYFNTNNRFQEIYDESKTEALKKDTDHSGKISTKQNLGYFLWLLSEREVFWRLFLTEYEMENYVPKESRPFPK